MADAQGSTPENRRYAQPHETMTAGFGETMRAAGYCDDDPHPQITTAQYESGAGQPLPSRPERAAANNARYGGVGETATPVIPEPCG